MCNVVVTTDSMSNLPRALVEKYSIRVIPLHVSFGKESFKDGVGITAQEFYERLEKDVLPTTSQPSPGEFKTFYRRIIEEGAKSIVSIHASREISRTVENAMVSAREFSEVQIEVIDTKTAAGAEGLVALEAARTAMEGAVLEKVVRRAEELIPMVGLLGVVDTLEYLYKGGRIGGAKRLTGSLLRIKPLLHMSEEGRIDALGKARTMGKAFARIVQIIKKRAGVGSFHGIISHGNNPEGAKELREKIEEHLRCKELYVNLLTPVLGTHAGPRTIVVFSLQLIKINLRF